MPNMTQRGPLVRKNYILSSQKTIFKIEIFWSEIGVKKRFFDIGKSNWLKMQNLTQRDALITKNYI